MIDNKPTYEIADNFVEKFVLPIAVGDLAKRFDGRDEQGRLLDLYDDHLSGKQLVLVFLNNLPGNLALNILQALTSNLQKLHAKEAALLVIHSNSDADVSQRLKLAAGYPYPILGDPSGVIHAKYGLHKNHGVPVRIVLLSRYRQIQAWYDSSVNIDSVLRVIMTQLTKSPAAEHEKWYPVHAPILIVPNVFSTEECSQIVKLFESRGAFRVAQERVGDTAVDFKVPVYEHNRQDRIDHVIRDSATIQFMDQRVGERVNPMIKKAFAFEVTRREDFHIARYVGERGGIHMGHRDNTSAATAYRRFAFSMNLNDGYTGGGIVFKEFNDHAYRPDPGTVLIFSSSLLHEVQETTEGTRYSLITHLFNDAAAQK